MSEKETILQERILELEQELALKENQLQTYRLQLTKTNQQLEKIIAQLSQELRLAGLLQKKLSPTELPHISGFEFSTKFIPGTKQGGDYFDIFEHDDRLRFGIIMASSSGYSMSALFLTVLMKMASRIESRKGLLPHETLQKIFEEMKPMMGAQDLASLFYGLFDKRSYELHYASLGSLYGVRQRWGYEALDILEPQAPSIGLQFSAELQTRVIALESKDRLVLVSDGVLAASNTKGENWGLSGLSDAIRAAPKQGVHELRNEILFRLEKFVGKNDFLRDLTVVVVEVKEHVIKLAKSD